jgi:hypothetical protein
MVEAKSRVLVWYQLVFVVVDLTFDESGGTFLLIPLTFSTCLLARGEKKRT